MHNRSLAPTCKACRRPGYEEDRRLWGCDAPAAAPVFRTSCPRCGGEGGSCAFCGGAGEMEHFRCPRMASAGTEEVLAAIQDVDAGYGFPAPGDLCDQAAFFADAMRHAAAEKARIESRRDKASADVRNMIGSS